MSNSFKDLKNAASISTLSEALESLQNKKFKADERFWKAPPLATSGEGSGTSSAVIRFLPAAQGETIPFVKLFQHYCYDPRTKKYFIENCPTSIGLKCPVCEANSVLWNSGSPKNQKIAKDRKRKLVYISNILVLADKSRPENVGKVFLWKFGQKIMDKIKYKLKGDDDGAKPLPVFNLLEGANFRLRCRKVDDFVNYDTSEFDMPSQLYDGDETKLLELWGKCHPLQPFVAPEAFKSYDVLAREFEAWQNSRPATNKTANDVEEDGEDDDLASAAAASSRPAVSRERAPTPAPSKPSPNLNEDEEDAEELFGRLAKEAGE